MIFFSVFPSLPGDKPNRPGGDLRGKLSVTSEKAESSKDSSPDEPPLRLTCELTALGGGHRASVLSPRRGVDHRHGEMKTVLAEHRTQLSKEFLAELRLPRFGHAHDG
jgi:hypothetical protein